jgi:hypothetical protein
MIVAGLPKFDCVLNRANPPAIDGVFYHRVFPSAVILITMRIKDEVGKKPKTLATKEPLSLTLS